MVTASPARPLAPACPCAGQVSGQCAGCLRDLAEVEEHYDDGDDLWCATCVPRTADAPLPTTLTFFVPDPDDEHADRTDSRVLVLDHDEVTRSSRVEFTDGHRLVVADKHLVTRTT